MTLDHLSVILVEPQGERNIGSVARAMANFGMNDLRLVAPKVDHLHDEARKMAVKAWKPPAKTNSILTITLANGNQRLFAYKDLLAWEYDRYDCSQLEK